MASRPVPTMPSPNRTKANSPATGWSASAACAEALDIGHRRPSCSVAAVVTMIAIAMRLENAMPTRVSARMRSNALRACVARLHQRLCAAGWSSQLFRLLRGLPEEQVGRNRGAEDGDQGGEEVGCSR